MSSTSRKTAKTPDAAKDEESGYSAVRAKAQAGEEAARRSSVNRRRFLIGLGAVAAVGAVGAGFAAKDSADTHAAEDRNDYPKNFDPDGAVSFTKDGWRPRAEATAPNTIDIFFDFSCSHCAEFEHVHSSELNKAVSDGRLAVRLHPVVILEQSKEWTLMALGAWSKVVSDQPDAALSYYGLITEWYLKAYEEQDTTKLTGSALQDLASNAGVKDRSFSALTEDGWVAKANAAFDKAGYTGTPTILLNGKKMDLAAIDKAGSIETLLK